METSWSRPVGVITSKFQAIFKVEIHNVAGQIEFEECQEKLIFSTYFTLRVLLIITLRLLFLMILVEGYDAH